MWKRLPHWQRCEAGILEGMDANTLRLILAVAGVLLVAGIYLWDRHKRRQWRPGQARRVRAQAEPSIENIESVGHADSLQELPEMPAEPESRPTAGDDDLPPGEFVGEPVVRQRWVDDAEEQSSQLTMDLEFGADADSDYLHIDPALMDEVPRLIVQIVVMSKEAPFTQAQIRQATKATDMRFGAMDIYHRENAQGQVLFSLASVVEPGTFPKGADEVFTTPGLVLFTQLPGVQDGLAIYSDMLFTAERLAALLDADLLDETRSALTRQSIEHTRESILEHRRKIQLLRSRH
ncbi:MAG: hypothetical protein D6720_11850 [Gammaproteobacteria bacterium]|nr:MAG: hypothetical protein D6720_11850 [Gammaproteobacteria bacterium]